ncbi:MAG: hypothetical protein HGN29_08335 [Asgard group archaeon]|nr:hypothetical protein [Asgard group archaeon]
MSSEIKYGLVLIQFNEFSDPNLVVEFAIEAEKAGCSRRYEKDSSKRSSFKYV